MQSSSSSVSGQKRTALAPPEQPHERSKQPKSHTPKTVFVLVKTSDKEGHTPEWETQCNSEVVGVYATFSLAEKAKRIETRGMDSNDGITYNCGECYNTTYQIHEEAIQKTTEDSEDDDEYDY